MIQLFRNREGYRRISILVLVCLFFGLDDLWAQKKRYPYVTNGKTIVCREGNDGLSPHLIKNIGNAKGVLKYDYDDGKFVASKFEVHEGGLGAAYRRDAENKCPDS